MCPICGERKPSNCHCTDAEIDLHNVRVDVEALQARATAIELALIKAGLLIIKEEQT